MTDISNNFSNFDKGNNYNKEVIPKEEVPSKIEDKHGPVPAYETLPAADVLGRSQVPSSPKGSDVTGSVNEAVAVAEKFADTPEVLTAADDVFEMLYAKFIKEGMSPEEAYAKAAFGEGEFTNIAGASKASA